MLLLLSVLVAPPALAAPNPREAEALRLTEEITRLSEKTAWAGVERKYEQLLELKNVDVNSFTHLQAAHAAQARGDIATANVRANRAIKAAKSDPDTLEKASAWVADFLVNYGEVQIELSVAYRGDAIVESRDPVFAPKVRAILGFATERLAADRTFTGYLPIGRYKVGDETFDVDGSSVKVFVKPVKDAPVTQATAPEPPLGERVVVLAARGGGWAAASWSDTASRIRDALYEADGVLAVDVKGPDTPWVVVRPNVDAMSSRGLTMVGLAERVRAALPDAQVVFSADELAVSPGVSAPAVAAVVVVDATPEIPAPAPPPPETPEGSPVAPEGSPVAPEGSPNTPGGPPPEGSAGPATPEGSTEPGQSEVPAPQPIPAKPAVTLGEVARVAPGDPSIPVPADAGTVPRYSLHVRTNGPTEALTAALQRVEGAQGLGIKPEAPPSR
ncbi:MAG: hypothetical protein H6737_30865 [Alphaproteobacteria bacterium]|nr:hypothetical protein [Alphaproteobacteria bacterium]